MWMPSKKDGKIQFSIKNISENPLNFQADELTERFIRGDVSRSTEGSGLGTLNRKEPDGIAAWNLQYLSGRRPVQGYDYV